MAARVYNAAEVKQDLYDRIPGDGELMALLGDSSIGDIARSIWQYVSASSATDNFTGGVIKPTLQTGNGRWLRRDNFPVIPKRQETYSGTTGSDGQLTINFSSSFPAAPNVQFSVVGLAANQFARITSITASACTVHVFQRNSVNLLGTDLLLSTVSNVNNASVDFLVTEK